MSLTKNKKLFRRRQKRVRSKIDSKKLRLSIHRSSQNIYAQVIDDQKSVTLVSSSTLDMSCPGNIEGAQKVGAEIAKKSLELGIKEIVFDRGGYLYHGRVKALAEAARENGLQF
jgi:large subunit ribosomal protein L18